MSRPDEIDDALEEQTSCQFLDLPTELRFRILAYFSNIFCRRTMIILETPAHSERLALLQTCNQLRAEAGRICYSAVKLSTNRAIPAPDYWFLGSEQLEKMPEATPLYKNCTVHVANNVQHLVLQRVYVRGDFTQRSFGRLDIEELSRALEHFRAIRTINLGALWPSFDVVDMKDAELDATIALQRMQRIHSLEAILLEWQWGWMWQRITPRVPFEDEGRVSKLRMEGWEVRHKKWTERELIRARDRETSPKEARLLDEKRAVKLAKTGTALFLDNGA